MGVSAYGGFLWFVLWSKAEAILDRRMPREGSRP
jgi:hypothetical protein